MLGSTTHVLMLSRVSWLLSRVSWSATLIGPCGINVGNSHEPDPSCAHQLGPSTICDNYGRASVVLGLELVLTPVDDSIFRGLLASDTWGYCRSSHIGICAWWRPETGAAGGYVAFPVWLIDGASLSTNTANVG